MTQQRACAHKKGHTLAKCEICEDTACVRGLTPTFLCHLCSGVYSCTSSGAFRFSPFEGQSAASPVELELPGPLQHLIFYPPLNPEYFFYGGEEIPLSLWDVEVAMSPAPSGNEVAPSDSRDDQDANGVAYSSKMKKRKRQAELKAKAKELMWGEVWRAKNVSFAFGPVSNCKGWN